MFLNEFNYPFTGILKRNWKIIQNECLKVSENSFISWPERYLYGYQNTWKVFGIIKFGKVCSSVCPQTAKILKQIPHIYTGGISLLKAGAVIKPHKGKTKGIIRCHLGLKIPQNCGLKVAGKTKQWKEGSMLIFDDTSEHSAFNKSNEDRVVLLVDIKR